jgi:hypothetical protein
MSAPTAPYDVRRDNRRDPYDDPYQEAEQRSLGDLLSDLTDGASMLFRQELELAKLELKRDATRAGKAGGMLAAGAVLGLFTLMLLLFAASWGLAAVMPTGFAFLIVGVIVGAVAAGLAMAGRKRLRQVDLAPRTTIETLREDKEWISHVNDR